MKVPGSSGVSPKSSRNCSPRDPSLPARPASNTIYAASPALAAKTRTSLRLSGKGGLLSAVLLMGCICSRSAQQPDPPQSELAPTDEQALMREIPSVYAASKYDQKVTQAPSYVTIITSDEIAAYGYRTLAEILESVPGFYVTYDRNYDYLGVRGFSRPGDYNSRVLLLVDGTGPTKTSTMNLLSAPRDCWTWT